MNHRATINSEVDTHAFVHEDLYTEDEINARLSASEDDFNAGRCYTNEQVLSELRSFIDSL